MGETKDWVFIRRRSGGAYLHISHKTLDIALEKAQIPPDTPLQVKRYPLRGTKGSARILLCIKERQLDDIRRGRDLRFRGEKQK